MQAIRVLKVASNPGFEAFGLPYVNDPAGGIEELIGARHVGDCSGGRTGDHKGRLLALVSLFSADLMVMERCENCQNILPRTVDRCPVCGHAANPAAVSSTPNPQDHGAAWAPDSQPTTTKSVVPAPQLAPREPQRQPGAPDAPYEKPRTVTRSGGFDDDGARKVLAASSRIEANIVVGPSPKHGLYNLGAVVIAVLAMLAGAVIGYPSDETTIAPTDLPTPSTLPLTASNEFSIDAAGIANTADASLVQLTVSGCDLRTKVSGFITQNGFVVASRAAVLTDPNPVITTRRGKEVNGKVIGWSSDTDMAIIQAESDLGTGLSWGSSRRLKVDSELVVVETFSDQVIGTNLRVSDVATRNGVITSFGFGDTSPRSGSPALNEFASVLGVVNATGRLMPAEEVRELIGDYLVKPMNLSGTCG